MSGAGTRTKSGEKARAKSAGSASAAKSAKSAKSAKGTKAAGRSPVRSGSAGSPSAPARRARSGPEPEPKVRHRRRALLWTLVVVTLLVAAAVGAVYSPLLDVRSVEVTGVAPQRVAAVERASGVAVGDPLLTFLPGRVAGHVEDLPWVETATVRRDLRGTVRIAVVPRVPVGWVKAGSRVLVVDGEGQVIAKVDAPPAGVPELQGAADLGPVGGQIRPVSLAAAAGALGPELRSRVATVALDDGAVTAQLVYGPQLRFGTPERVGVKARVAAAVLASLGRGTVDYVDVSVPAAPVSG